MGFGSHDPKYGPRLGRQLELGPSGLLRQIVDRGPAGRPGVEGSFVGSPSAFPEPAPSAVRLEGRVLAASNVEKKVAASGPRKVGRPRKEGVRPWDALKISRAAYFRRKAAGELG